MLETPPRIKAFSGSIRSFRFKWQLNQMYLVPPACDVPALPCRDRVALCATLCGGNLHQDVRLQVVNTVENVIADDF